jgi:hypothetical protein
VHVKFIDWIPGICSALGMLVINSIEKSRLSADTYSYSGSGVAWKARFVLFLGFALLAGGLAGSVVSIYNYYPSYAGRNIPSHSADHLIYMLIDGLGPQICRQELPVADAVLWYRQCHRQRLGHAKVSP